jgi:UV DNA damage endonuclease
MRAVPRLRLGLCCVFVDQPIRFRTTTATSLLRLTPTERRHKLGELCLANAESLLEAVRYCAENGIGSFRVNSQILPLKTHPEAGYEVDDLPGSHSIVSAFRSCGDFARANEIRTGFHPDQFVVLNSPRPEVVSASIAELEYQAQVAEWIGADVINIHAGGAYGDKLQALASFERNVDRLSDSVRSRLTIENDDRTFKPCDLLPLCRAAGIPLVYDVHHHRCLPDGLSVEEATAAAIATWNREPLFHISSPREGWRSATPHHHHDYIDRSDFPDCWRRRALTVEVEAKAKERAVLRLRDELFPSHAGAAARTRVGRSRGAAPDPKTRPARRLK